MPTLLLADDSLTIQRVVELTFAGEDVDVVSVGNGDDAILRIAAIRPDIVFADIAMPRRSGYDVSAFVKGRPDLAHIPVLLLAGAFEPVDRARAEAVRCDGVLIKPFEPKQVIARVRELVGRRLPVEPPPVPQPPAPRPDTFDDYLDRIDAAFATIEPQPELTSAGPGGAMGASLDDYLEQLNATAAPSPLTGSSGDPVSTGDVPPPIDPLDPPLPTLADLTDGPRREPGDARVPDAMAAALRLASADEAAPPTAAVGPDVEALVQRVLARLLPDVEAHVRQVVRDEMDRVGGTTPDYNVSE